MGTAALRSARFLTMAALLAASLFGLPTPSTGPAASAAATPDSESSIPGSDDPIRLRGDLLEHLGVAAWHRRGERGRGVKVAILDSGFRGYRAYLGRALPASVLTRSFRADGNLEARDSQHGILCAEVVHTLAPDAELLLANWEPDRSDQFLDAVRWARQQGARVLTCSVIMPAWSDGEGHGVIHRELSHLLGSGDGPDDALCFASAGNTAQRHWSGVFRDGGNGCHAWAEAVNDNGIRPWGSERVSVDLSVPAGTALEVSVSDVTAGREVGRSSTQGSRTTATVRFSPRAGHDYSLRVTRLLGPAGFFHLVVLGAGLQYATAHGSIPFPGDGPEVIAVGAVDQAGHHLAYSSCGPNSDRPKPDFVAPVPFPSLWRAKPFSGTSAAAPQAAAIGALMFARHRDWTALHIRRALEATAEDLGPPGHDWETGFGRVRLP
jgi:subtilisin family serine protease